MKINYNQWDEDEDYLDDERFVPIKRFSNKERVFENNKKITYQQKRKKKEQERQRAEESFQQFCREEKEPTKVEDEYVDKWEDTSY